MRAIVDVVTARGSGGFFNDDQAAILAGRGRDGFVYSGEVVTPGYQRIRQPAEALSVLLVLDDGSVAHGDCVSVQYSGAAGREPRFSAAGGEHEVQAVLRPLFVGAAVDGFRALAERLASASVGTAVRYGASQALLAAAALAQRTTMAEVVAAEYGVGGRPRRVPVFAQTGEDRHAAVDKMVLRAVDELPHGLINTRELVGSDGAVLRSYVAWVRDRVLALRPTAAYAPVLHFDVYGLLGWAFPEPRELVDYLASLATIAEPFQLRVEHPLDAGGRDAQGRALADLRSRLLAAGVPVDIVVDEWCNTVADVERFLRLGAADMVHVKTPDLGSLDDAVRAVLACRANGVAAYFGGSCTDTERSAQVCSHVAMGASAQLILAKPGMGVDEGVMITRNEMARVEALTA